MKDLGVIILIVGGAWLFMSGKRIRPTSYAGWFAEAIEDVEQGVADEDIAI